VLVLGDRTNSMKPDNIHQTLSTSTGYLDPHTRVYGLDKRFCVDVPLTSHSAHQSLSRSINTHAEGHRFPRSLCFQVDKGNRGHRCYESVASEDDDYVRSQRHMLSVDSVRLTTQQMLTTVIALRAACQLYSGMYMLPYGATYNREVVTVCTKCD
jgi:hypothetical protein